MQPIGRFWRSIGHTCPLRGAKTDAQVAGFCEWMRGKASFCPLAISVYRQTKQAAFGRLFSFAG